MAATASHNYGPSCLLHADSNVFTRRASKVFIDAPPIKAQYFYCSSLPIDDPLSPVPPPPSGTAKIARLPPQPFSLHDNRDLEEAWLSLHKSVDSSDQYEVSSKSLRHEKTQNSERKPKIDGVAESLQNSQKTKAGSEDKSRASEDSAHKVSNINDPHSTHSSPNSTPRQNQPNTIDFAPQNSSSQLTFDQPRQASSPQSDDTKLATYSDHNNIPFSETVPVKSEEIRTEEMRSNLRKKRSISPFRRKEKTAGASEQIVASEEEQKIIPYRRLSRSSPKNQHALELGSSPSERNTSGTPFLRVPSRVRKSKSRTGSSPDSQFRTKTTSADDTVTYETDEATIQSPTRPLSQRFMSSQSRESSQQSPCAEAKKAQIKVVVGISRLHTVEMPSLKVGDISPGLWSPCALLIPLLDGPDLLGPRP